MDASYCTNVHGLKKMEYIEKPSVLRTQFYRERLKSQVKKLTGKIPRKLFFP